MTITKALNKFLEVALFDKNTEVCQGKNNGRQITEHKTAV